MARRLRAWPTGRLCTAVPVFPDGENGAAALEWDGVGAALGRAAREPGQPSRHDERADAMIGRGFQHREGTQDVALERLGRAAFKQRQLLERRGVEHDAWSEPLDYLPIPVPVAHVCHDRLLPIVTGTPVRR